jgi:hypothetical protein
MDGDEDELTIRCKFNFHYMDFTQKAGQNFNDWKQTQLAGLLDKLRIYSAKPISHWEKERAGSKSGTIFVTYPRFPKKSITDFKLPKKLVPHQAIWGRFRLGSGSRLIGFVIPKQYDGKIHKNTKIQFDCNTFYAVFLDRDHKFWKSK